MGACDQLFPSIEDAENKWNCKERYGKRKTKEYCNEFTKANSEIFYYRLKNKYECLTSTTQDIRPEVVSQDVTDCINEYYDLG